MRLRTKIWLGFFVIGAVLFVHACVFDRATWYGESWRGKKMANGKPYNPDAMTCASWAYKLGTRLRITHEKHSVVVEVTDRGGKNRWYQFGKTIDLTPTAFSKLANPKIGSIEIKIHRVTD
jgi:rare lipoprotein A